MDKPASVLSASAGSWRKVVIAKTIKVVPQEVEVDSVFCIDAFAIVGPGLTILPDVLESIRAQGFTWRPNAKINIGLGRAWD